MAYNPATGQWTEENADVAPRMKGLLSQDNPLMQQARTQGVQFANRRGLLNSSMAGEAAQKAAVDVALPIASQEAQQVHQRNLTGQDIDAKDRIAKMNVASHDREKATAAATAMANTYAEAWRTVAQQHELPAATRDQYLEHLVRIRDSDLGMVEQMYGISLSWDSPPVAPVANPKTPAPSASGAPAPAAPAAPAPAAPAASQAPYDSWWWPGP